MKLLNTGTLTHIVMLPNGEQAFFYMEEPVACRTLQGLWYRVHQSGSLIVEGHLQNYLKAHQDVMNWCSKKEMEEMVEKFGGAK